MTLLMREREKIELGENKKLVSQIRDVDTTIELSIVASILKVTPAFVEKVLTLIEEHPDWDDEDIASKLEEDE